MDPSTNITSTSAKTAHARAYETWFQEVTGFPSHDWQRDLGTEPGCRHRLVRIPTGLGKTAGTVLAWLYHRVTRTDNTWPRRLVFTLPMRVLVEQTEHALHTWRARAGLDDQVDIHTLMGGVRTEPWILAPERPAILLGTQDMLLSRALNRGYGAARGRWPMDFALLNQDVLWVLDEIQLMDVGLMTSVQLAAFRARDQARGPWPRPAVSWWMSATLQPAWLRSTDAADLITPLANDITEIPAPARQGGPWDIRKPAERRADVHAPAEIAALVRERHRPGSLTLVIVNRVDRAVETAAALEQAFSPSKGHIDEAPALQLIHSRFRGTERRAWSNEATGFLRKDACSPAALPAPGRIIVSTQVVEAGVDISAALLITDLAPWPSLVQRCGRAARYPGEEATVIVVGPVPERDRDALPYDTAALHAADEAWARLDTLAGGPDASLRGLTAFEDALHRDDTDLLARLYPYDPAHVLTRTDLDGLFDTTPDLTGADIDVSCFVRTGEERNVSMFWRALERSGPERKGQERAYPKRIARADIGPVTRDELCPVPVNKETRDWLARDGRTAYVLDYIEGAWMRIDLRQNPLTPGMLVLVPADQGGYRADAGWDARSKSAVAPVEPAPTSPPAGAQAGFLDTATAEDDDSASMGQWKTIATHGAETAREVRAICDALGIAEPLRAALALAARWHDAGKAHTAFQGAIRDDARDQAPAGACRELAKAPANTWRRPPYPQRPGFRHELASTLALLELLRRTRPDHPALLGPHQALMQAAGMEPVPLAEAEHVDPAHPLAAELAALDAETFDLVAYLVCSHHGKVRCAWTGTPHDQEKNPKAIHGVAPGDELDGLRLCDHGDQAHALPALTLDLDAAAMGLSARYGASWSERVAGLLRRLGPFTLAYLESLLRAADCRASQLTNPDPLL